MILANKVEPLAVRQHLRKEHAFFLYVNLQLQINQVQLSDMQRYGLGYLSKLAGWRGPNAWSPVLFSLFSLGFFECTRELFCCRFVLCSFWVCRMPPGVMI